MRHKPILVGSQQWRKKCLLNDKIILRIQYIFPLENLLSRSLGLKYKSKSKWISDSLEARLVAKGYSKMDGIDCLETFSPVAKMTSISLAISYNKTLQLLDVKNAFLHNNLEEELYIEQPQGFIAQG